ncbi:MAG: hypothetical protein IJL89_09560 [Firmicutes bacterium]|nr:hypothetical protein [Bacillota bacterium]
MVKKYIEKLYTGVCDIYEFIPEVNEKGVTELREELIYKDQPCRLSYTTRLSYSGLKSSMSREAVLVNSPVQQIKLFLSPDIRVKAGCRISVTQNGLTQEYKNSGETAMYRFHQEIVLEKLELWT